MPSDAARHLHPRPTMPGLFVDASAKWLYKEHRPGVAAPRACGSLRGLPLLLDGAPAPWVDCRGGAGAGAARQAHRYSFLADLLDPVQVARLLCGGAPDGPRCLGRDEPQSTLDDRFLKELGHKAAADAFLEIVHESQQFRQLGEPTHIWNVVSPNSDAEVERQQYEESGGAHGQRVPGQDLFIL